eukprot:SAG11_NODE_3593_length_2349_cov_2.378222_4_plen_267_part_00
MPCGFLIYDHVVHVTSQLVHTGQMTKEMESTRSVLRDELVQLEDKLQGQTSALRTRMQRDTEAIGGRLDATAARLHEDSSARVAALGARLNAEVGDVLASVSTRFAGTRAMIENGLTQQRQVTEVVTAALDAKIAFVSASLGRTVQALDEQEAEVEAMDARVDAEVSTMNASMMTVAVSLGTKVMGMRSHLEQRTSALDTKMQSMCGQLENKAVALEKKVGGEIEATARELKIELHHESVSLIGRLDAGTLRTHFATALSHWFLRR